MNVVKIKDLGFKYHDGTQALDGVDLVVEEGDRIVVLGPNGAGKSTLLKLIAGLLNPTKGSVKVFGLDVTKKKEAEKARGNVGLLFQDPDDQIFMPVVAEDVAFGPVNMGLAEKEVNRRVKKALAQAGLSGYEKRIPHHLSYGERKRVAIAGILAMDPKLLLLDEFTSNLDPKGKDKMIRVVDVPGKTLIFATHDMNTAVRLADKVLILDRRVLRFGPVEEVLTDHKLLKRAKLDMPDVTKLFLELRKRGMKIKKLPLRIEEAIGILTRKK